MPFTARASMVMTRPLQTSITQTIKTYSYIITAPEEQTLFHLIPKRIWFWLAAYNYEDRLSFNSSKNIPGTICLQFRRLRPLLRDFPVPVNFISFFKKKL